jgi:hypothetical protein
MSPRRMVAAAAAFAGIAMFSIAGAQAEEAHAHHHMHMAHHHHHAAPAEAAEGAVAAPVMAGGNYEPSEWGDFECVPSYPGCRPYASKDWSKP